MSSIEISGGSTKEALEAENLDHLLSLACADIVEAVDMTAEVVDNSIIANVLTDDGDTSTYDRRTDSLEAISNKIGGFSGDGGAASDDSIKSAIDLLQGGAYKGTVTTYTNSTTFASTDLVGFGDGAFIGWSVFVFRDAVGGGAAPQQQDNVAITGYTSATGTFTHTAFGSGTLATTDEVLIIQPAIAAIGFRTSGATTGAPGTTYPLMALIKQVINCVYRLGETACADTSDPVDMTTEIVDNSILANILSDDGDTSAYDRRYYSLEAISKRIGASDDAATVPLTGSDSAKLSGIGKALGLAASGAGTGFEIDGSPNLYEALSGSVNAVNRAIGKEQIKATTIDLAQAAASYTLLTGTTQDVIIESLLIRLPAVNVSDDATITSISIQTNDATPQVFINSVVGAKAYLTSEAQLGWTGTMLLKAGKLIQLTIAGGAADAATVCDVVVKCRAVVSGGYLA